MQSVYIILNNVRSAHNVGSILRTADCAGVKKVYLCGYTPEPTDRFGRVRKDISKVALGAEGFVETEHFENAEDVFALLKKDGVKVVAVEQHKNSTDYANFSTDKDVAFVFGEERFGLPEDLIKKSDEIVEIPMRGKKESLNVSVSVGVVLFRFVENFS
jgi:tRNA G18 (ribose-2'-O)-methylase SpoU